MTIAAEVRADLVSLARSAVAAEVTSGPLPRVKSKNEIFAELRGCFVTLTNHGKLRGCIGTFQPRSPLGETIIEMCRAAARDPRFVMDRISPSELAELTVEVSVLSPLELTDKPRELVLGTHGIYIVSGVRSGCFLPEVATDMGWSVQEFLSHCCQSKAGLGATAWQEPGTQVFLFTSEKFDH